MAGKIYILRTPGRPGLFKIGSTEGDPNARAKQLSNSTGVPQPYSLAFYCEIPEQPCRVFENALHKKLAYARVSPDREFFDLPHEEIRETVARMRGEEPFNEAKFRERVSSQWNEQRRGFWLSLFSAEACVAETVGFEFRLSDRAAIADKIQELCALAKRYTITAVPHICEIGEGVCCCLNLFSENGICFITFDITIAWKSKLLLIARHRLAEVCDALQRREREILSTIGAIR